MLARFAGSAKCGATRPRSQPAPPREPRLPRAARARIRARAARRAQPSAVESARGRASQSGEDARSPSADSRRGRRASRCGCPRAASRRRAPRTMRRCRRSIAAPAHRGPPARPSSMATSLHRAPHRTFGAELTHQTVARPARAGTRPWLGRKPNTLFHAAGLRSDPMKSLPSATGSMCVRERDRRAAAAAARRLRRVERVARDAEHRR